MGPLLSPEKAKAQGGCFKSPSKDPRLWYDLGARWLSLHLMWLSFEPTDKKMMRGRPIIDLFAGAGGFSVGATKAGRDVRLSVKIDPVRLFH